MTQTYNLFATAPRQLEAPLAEELEHLGAQNIEQARAGVQFTGDLELAYRVCLWSRIASRVLLHLKRFKAADTDELYQAVGTLTWADHLVSNGTLAIDCHCTGSPITNSHFAALKVKDAIVDQFWSQTSRRPNIDLTAPDLRLNLLLKGEEGILSVDLSGDSLHRRHYRAGHARAPLKENLAAGLLSLAQWPRLAREGRPFIDPMCGSGTLPLEAGLIAADLAPGLLRSYWGFQGWRGHQPELWSRVLEEAHEKARRPHDKLPLILGYDADPRHVKAARANVERAGLKGLVRIEQQDLASCRPSGDGDISGHASGGVLITNPPYGIRLGESDALAVLYTQLGDLFKQRFAGWTCHLLTGNTELAAFIGLKPARRFPFFNGALECRLLSYPIVQGKQASRPAPEGGESKEEAPRGGAEMFSNRLRKNLKHLHKWTTRHSISCFRVYDADLPEYAVAIDLYERWVLLQEYKPPKSIEPAVAQRRLRHVLSLVPEVLGIPSADLFLHRQIIKGLDKISPGPQSLEQVREVREGGHRFLINLTDPRDTGLPLERRSVRELVQTLAKGGRVCNLSSRAGASMIYAVHGGATGTVSLVPSALHLEWTKRNYLRNGLKEAEHAVIQAEVGSWLKKNRDRFDLVLYTAPPRHRRDEERTDQLPRVLPQVIELLEPGGVLLLSSATRPVIPDDLAEGLRMQEISRSVQSKDFERVKKPAPLWKISKER